ncbi:MAG: hypothetical protein IH947_11380 [Bacteroidetes bacterium]|nr:hypothetical protein [Bacteroidota bacterium]
MFEKIPLLAVPAGREGLVVGKILKIKKKRHDFVAEQIIGVGFSEKEKNTSK